MKLYSYYRSSAAYRVRIALNLKHIDHLIIPVNLLKKEHQSADYLGKQPQGLVPCLEINDGQILTQSGAILNYLDSLYSESRLIPPDPFQATKIRSFVDIIACDIHPLCNLRVLNYLTEDFEVNAQQKLIWYHHWIRCGFSALERSLKPTTYCFGEDISLADVYLIPQVYNALRFEVDMSAFPKLSNVYQSCNLLESFIAAKPENQIDAL